MKKKKNKNKKNKSIFSIIDSAVDNLEGIRGKIKHAGRNKKNKNYIYKKVTS